ncbi:MAG: hypothetical protein UR60_C0008G0015 [Candidatus Moranbacteria bacterium GW2011_GWF2_34_56]|nr:MAG: hypothetical protein UR51_C0002G0112 [Candidatus Moranbacteria bacterium GW2011_GWF1_34_10]KKP65143.1 MAG: hypothetical protein UR60_C0008G0015 [Candidatus Moranbacteria bacterium GW2011_GWF2_34_56]HBI16744.1 hypothetical protein [Candidatus Moranbacteria bacterium]
MEKDLDSIPQKPGNRKQKIERAAKKKKQKNDHEEGDNKSLIVDIEVENSSNNLEDIQRQLDREMQLEIDKVSNSDELDMDERSAKIELITLGYKKRLLEEQKKIEIEGVSKSSILDDKMRAELIESIEVGCREKIENLKKEDEDMGGNEDNLMLGREIELEVDKTAKAIDEIEKIIGEANVNGEVATFIHDEMGQLNFSKEDIENFRKNTDAMASEYTKESLQDIISRRKEMEGFVEKYRKQIKKRTILTNDSAKEDVDIDDNNVVKELPPIIKKAIKDKDFAQNLAEHEMLIGSDEELMINDIKEIKKEAYSLLGFFGKKLEEFKEAYPKDTDFQNKISAIIEQYRREVGEFDVIKEVSRKTLTKINQLRHDMQKWADRDWIELYERKNGTGIFEKSVEVDDAISDLAESELHGEHGASIEKVKDIEAAKKIIELEDQYGETGTVYIRHDNKTGFPIDSFGIVGYELGENEKNTFVITKKLVDDMEVIGKIDLKSFRKDKRYQRVKENSKENIESTKEDGSDEKILSPEDIKKLLSSINAIKERRGDLGMDKVSLSNKFKDFALKHKDEKEFNKDLMKRIHLLDDKFAQINRKFKKMEESDEMDENILNEINKLDSEIINLISSNWEEELLKFKESSEGAEFKFTEKEKNIVEKSKEIANRFVEGARSKFPWEKFPQERVDFTLETQAVFFLMEEFRKRKFFTGNEENVAEFIIKNRK